jgi:ribonucleoside-diphosphate reductase alpha chain
VASWLASTEHDPSAWEAVFYDAINNFEFLPAGRILAGAGTGRDVTCVNCFVMGRIDDSLEGIMTALRDSALTLKQGGGIGMDFSTLRPRGAIVRGVDSVSSGAVSFMGLWDSMCSTIMSAGARRGAMMSCLRCDHPDIEEFIAAKSAKGRLTNFNLSVLVTDAFMRAVAADDPWPLIFDGVTYRTVDAKKLWAEITELTYEHAEPGVIFIDTINRANPLSRAETIYATNPCGEQCLPPYGACILGSINLARLVRQPFSAGAVIDMDRLEHLAAVAVRMLDNVNDLSNYPLPQQQAEAVAKRRIGIGITGLGNALIMLGQRYGSSSAVKTVSLICSAIEGSAVRASEAIGLEKGSFRLFDESDYGNGLKARRNSHLTSIAPTGTISLLAGNVSGGIEPIFAFTGSRRVLNADGSHRIERTEDYAYRLAQHLGMPTTGPAWVTADDLTVDDHLGMMAAAQVYIDSAISKTVNCPTDMTLQAFQDVYRRAHAMGLKGCATYRPSETRGAVLMRDEPEPAPSNVVQIGEPLIRPEVLHGTTYKVKVGEHALYVTVNDVDIGGRCRPFELFLSSKEVDGYPWRVALSRMISAIFRKGGDVSFVADELKAVFDPRGGWWHDGRLIPSQPAAIGGMIERHMASLGLSTASDNSEPVKHRHCPRCQTGALVFREGCQSCDSCDYTKC